MTNRNLLATKRMITVFYEIRGEDPTAGELFDWEPSTASTYTHLILLASDLT